MNVRPIAAALALGTLATGCVDNAASVEIFAICAPPDDAAVCAGSATCEAVLASDRPWVFVTVGGAVNRLEQFVQLNNQIPNNAEAEIGRVNTNDFIGEAWVLSFSGLAGVADKVHPANFTVPAGGSQSPVIPIIPEDRMTQIGVAMTLAGLSQALVVVDVSARGRLVGGQEIETAPFKIAVDVFNADFTGAACPTAGDVRWYCPNAGQTASTACEAP